MLNKLNLYKKKIDLKLENYFNNIKNVNNILLESIKYSIFSGGKRLRPIILLEFYNLFNKNNNLNIDVYDFACAIEIIHTYSLIHDDLPCMDDDSTRRNKPCNHIIYGQDIALLAGDALIFEAFEMLLYKNKNYKNILKILEILLKSGGAKGIISGQVLDLKTQNIKSKDELLEIYKLKTGILFSAASEMGAILADASEEEINISKKYGEIFGIIFQLTDDILDIEKDKKLNYIFLYGLEEGNKIINKLIIESKNLIDKFDNEKTIFLKNLVNNLKFRDK